MLGKARMIQHNDSDTSCMRALALLERTFASKAELPPICTRQSHIASTAIWRHVLHKCC